MSRLQFALSNIVFARTYTLQFLDGLPDADWFRLPPGGVTHIAWQVGHLAIAQYFLVLDRVRGVKPEDELLIPTAFRNCFERGSYVGFDPAEYPLIEEIRATFDRVHEAVLTELPGVPDAELDTPVTRPHKIAKTKLDVLNWCSAHEMVHAGQIALLRTNRPRNSCRRAGRGHARP